MSQEAVVLILFQDTLASNRTRDTIAPICARNKPVLAMHFRLSMLAMHCAYPRSQCTRAYPRSGLTCAFTFYSQNDVHFDIQGKGKGGWQRGEQGPKVKGDPISIALCRRNNMKESTA